MKAFLAVIAIIISLSSCYTYRQDIGKGIVKTDRTDTLKARPKIISVTQKRWYLMWGLSPLNTVDSKKMAKGAKDYTIRQRFSFTDFLIGIPTAYFLSTQTVTVKRVATKKLSFSSAVQKK